MLQQLTEKLIDVFGPDAIQIRTPHHIQVKCGHRMSTNPEGHAIELPNYHNIWITKDRKLKYLTYGKSGSSRRSPNINHLIDLLQKHNHHHTDLARAKEAIDLARLVKQAQAAHNKQKIDQAWYVDAGWKNGIATIGAVYVKKTEHGTDVIAYSWTLPLPSSAEAEHEAIRRAHSRTHSVPIFSDSQSVVEVAKAEGFDVHWIPRDQNKIADKIGNRRNAG